MLSIFVSYYSLFVPLPDKSIVKGDLKWYFLCPIEKKYSAGARMNRATDVGHWKITGNERPVHYDNTLVGSIKTLVFHMGKAPGKRTDWVIHEYRLDNKYLAKRGVAQVMLGYLSFCCMILLYPFSAIRGSEIIMHVPLD